MARKTGAQCIADMLDGYGVTHVFMVPAILRRTMAELERRTSIARVVAHSEKSAAYMADGYARASGRPGVCLAQCIGALNLAAGLRDAWLAHAPMIAFTGGPSAETRERGLYQEIDDRPAFEAYTKMNAVVDDPERIPDMLRQAFRAATTGRPGPVHLQFPGNEGQLDVHEIDAEPLFEPEYARAPAFRPRPEEDAVRRAVERIQQAERPVFVAGGGVRASGGGAALVRLAEGLGVPVATSLNGKDLILADNPLSVGVVGTYSRKSANQVVSEADLVIFAGTTAAGMTTNLWSVPRPGTAVVQIDIDPETAGRNYPADVVVVGDARVALEAMGDLNAPMPEERAAWLTRTRALCADWNAEFAPVLASDAVPIRPERICGELTELMPEDAIVLADTGHAGMWMGGLFDMKHPGQSYIRSAGHLGWAYPASIGVKCGAPDRPVVCFTGDLGFWYHIAEIETAARWNIPTVTIVNNNAAGNQSKRGFDRAYGGEATDQSRELWVYRPVDFARIAEEMGAVGIRVEKPEDFAPAFAKALKSKRPVVLDVVTDVEALAPLAWVP
ncbi:MAG: thiamine pyrophosphate-binding protein [Rhodospirillaceae bacterium]|nr:thiamine pyrophosphate-binding protein [Rhodospirillaceae bacterium]